MQKIRKILRTVSEKTNQPTNYYQQHQSHRTSLMLKSIWFETQNITDQMSIEYRNLVY